VNTSAKMPMVNVANEEKNWQLSMEMVRKEEKSHVDNNPLLLAPQCLTQAPQ